MFDVHPFLSHSSFHGYGSSSGYAPCVLTQWPGYTCFGVHCYGMMLLAVRAVLTISSVPHRTRLLTSTWEFLSPVNAIGRSPAFPPIHCIHPSVGSVMLLPTSSSSSHFGAFTFPRSPCSLTLVSVYLSSWAELHLSHNTGAISSKVFGSETLSLNRESQETRLLAFPSKRKRCVSYAFRSQ